MTITTVPERPLDPSYHLVQVAIAVGDWRGTDTTGVVAWSGAHSASVAATGWGRLLDIDPDAVKQIERIALEFLRAKAETGDLLPVDYLTNKLVGAISFVAWRAHRGEIVLPGADYDLAYDQVEQLAVGLAAAGVSSQDLLWICAGWGRVFDLNVAGTANWAKIDSRYCQPNQILTGLTEFALYVADTANATSD